MSLPSFRRTVQVMPCRSNRCWNCGHPAAGFQRAFRHIVQRDEIHMAGHSLQPFDQQICLPVLVVDSVHHGVLEGDPPAGDRQSNDGSSPSAVPHPPTG